LAISQDDISTTVAAERLQTSPQTVRELLERGELAGKKAAHGKGVRWCVDPESVESFIAEHGLFSGTRRSSRSPRAAIQEDIRQLQQDVVSIRGLLSPNTAIPSDLGVMQERDDLRASNVALREQMARMRASAELHAQADTQRAAMVGHLLAAVSAGESADDLRRQAVGYLEDAVAEASRPGHAGGLRTKHDAR